MLDKFVSYVDYRETTAIYEALLAEHGDSPQALGWPSPDDAFVRHRVMLSVLDHRPAGAGRCSILDIGCGAAHLLDEIVARGKDVDYIGVDLSPSLVELCRNKYPDRLFFQLDALDLNAMAEVPSCDYVIANGLLTIRGAMSDDEAWTFARTLISTCFAKAHVGIAFNMMSKHVDWERSDLFHAPFDQIAAFVRNELTHHYSFRSDYGLYDFTCFAYREPNGSN